MEAHKMEESKEESRDPPEPENQESVDCPPPAKLIQYDSKGPEYKAQVEKALRAIKKKKWSIRKSAKVHGIPKSSLHDLIKGKAKLGRPWRREPRVFSREAEQKLVDHVGRLVSLGYFVSRATFMKLATDSAVHAGKKKASGRLLTDQWMRSFQSRWPDLQIAKMQQPEMEQARATSREVVLNYFDELGDILIGYKLTDKPWFVFSVDETVFHLERPRRNFSAPESIKQAERRTPERGTATTVLATGSAAGQTIPPFFVHEGKCSTEDTPNKEAYPGSYHAVTDSGWSKGDIFRTYLEEHFLKFLPSREPEQLVLLLYDGHSPHISVSLIEFARLHGIVLFVLPAHTSHVLQPLGRSLFTPMRSFNNSKCTSFMVRNSRQRITRHGLTNLLSTGYADAMTPANLFSAFRATGVYPQNKGVVSPEQFAIAENYLERAARGELPVTNDTDNLVEPQPEPPQSDAGKPKQKSAYRPEGVVILEDTWLQNIGGAEESRVTSNEDAEEAENSGEMGNAREEKKKDKKRKKKMEEMKRGKEVSELDAWGEGEKETTTNTGNNDERNLSSGREVMEKLRSENRLAGLSGNSEILRFRPELLQNERPEGLMDLLRVIYFEETTK